jgi:hypothetical protein
MKMATLAQSLPAPPHPWTWFREFLIDELRPRPGRAAMTARMVVATTLVMIINMTFRIPYGAFGAVYALTLSRESLHSTVKVVSTEVIAHVVGAAAIVVGAMLFGGDPMLRFMWVVSIWLGLFIMWLVFDQLWSAPAGVEMKKTFISTLRLLAQFAREPSSKDRSVAIERSYSLRETINDHLVKVRTLADGVLFEFGLSRQQDLALRDRIRRWQPQLRLLFLTRIALVKYRLRLPGFELPEPVTRAQQEFDNELAGTLEGIADRMEGKVPEARENLEASLERLEQTTVARCPGPPQEALATPLQTFLPLSRTIEQLTSVLNQEI